MLRNNADAHISSLGYLWEDMSIMEYIGHQKKGLQE